MSEVGYSTDELHYMWKDACDEIDNLRIEVKEAYDRGRDDGYADGYETGYEEARLEYSEND